MFAIAVAAARSAPICSSVNTSSRPRAQLSILLSVTRSASGRTVLVRASRSAALTESGGVGAVGQRDGGQAAGDRCQTPVGADGRGSSGVVAVGRDQDAAVGERDGAGERGDLVTGQGGAARRDAGESALVCDADGDRVQRAFGEDGLGAALERSHAFGQAGQGVAFGEDRGVGRVEVFRAVVVARAGVAAADESGGDAVLGAERDDEPVMEVVAELAVPAIDGQPGGEHVRVGESLAAQVVP
jgi:hypothetical protein